MTIRVKCRTQYDITETGVKNRSYKSKIVFKDNTGHEITSDGEWNLARNQQCNWETINQIISLRTLPENITRPVFVESTCMWHFEFDVVDPASIFRDGNPVGYLLNDCVGVPMILGLDEAAGIASTIVSDGPEANIWFDLINQYDNK
jgi:hypothetical protein